jgi:alpha-tubulin suppressor-like RCC1 family protein
MISRWCVVAVVAGLSGLAACSSSNPPAEGQGPRPQDASVEAGDGSAKDDGGDASPVEEGSNTTDGAVTAVAATAVVVGARHACALTGAGAVLCWGDNGEGQLGDGTTMQRHAPVLVHGLTNPVKAIAAGDEHTCALDSTGAVLCWGSNASGALGDGSSAPQRGTPGPVAGLTGATSIGAGAASTCAAIASGSIVCWGANQFGQLGDGSMMTRSTPSATVGVLEGALAGPMSLAPGADHTCVIASAGNVECAGDDTNGALGNGGNVGVDTYVANGVTNDAVAVASSIGFSCALIDDGTVQCWGFGGDGELGNGVIDSTDMPAAVSGLAGATRVAAGFHHACAVTAAGVSCWGDLGVADLDAGSADASTNPLIPVAVAGVPSGVTAVAAGGGTCALTTAGAVLCWGDNTYGQLGDGTTTPRAGPVAVVGFP